jgi:hypothetical protein
MFYIFYFLGQMECSKTIMAVSAKFLHGHFINNLFLID